MTYSHPAPPGMEGDIPTDGDFPYKCKCPLVKDNFYSVFRPSSVSAVSQNNLYAKDAYEYFGVA